MRHISFDESTVLTELARIADEKGLIKKAEGQGVHNFPEDVVKGDPTQSVHNFPEDVVKGDPTQSVHNFSPDVIKGNPAGAKPKGLGSVPKNLQEALKLPPGPMRDAWVKKFMTVQNSPAANKNLSVSSRAKVDLSKEAKDGAYDVTGETGEDLIDSAHPGGGTKTELTHSKTDENLVETVVEQQEKDVEVARSVPKGTYATLMGLREKLQKMGLDDQIKSLDSVIGKIATTEDVVDYHLVSLADKLDGIGCVEASNVVDGIIKKIAIDVGEWAGWGSLWGPLGTGAGFLAGLIAKEFTVAQNVIGQLIANLKKLDPKTEDDEYKLNTWIARLATLQSHVRPFSATGDPEQDKELAAVKLGQLEEVAQYLKVVEDEFGKTQFTDWFRDKGQAQQVLSNAVSVIGKRVQDLKTQYAKQQQQPAAQQQDVASNKELDFSGESLPFDVDQGKAGKGGKRYQRGPEFKKQQQRYNTVWSKLKDIGLTMSGFPPKLNPDGINGPKTMRALKALPQMEKILKNEAAKSGAAGKSEPKSEQAEYIPMGEIRNAIVDKILKSKGLRPHEVNLDTLYGMALQTARKNYKRKALTKDNAGYRRLETWVSDIVNHPNFEKSLAKFKK